MEEREGVYTKAETHSPSRWTLVDIWYEGLSVGDKEGVVTCLGTSLLRTRGEKNR